MKPLGPGVGHKCWRGTESRSGMLATSCEPEAQGDDMLTLPLQAQSLGHLHTWTICFTLTCVLPCAVVHEPLIEGAESMRKVLAFVGFCQESVWFNKGKFLPDTSGNPAKGPKIYSSWNCCSDGGRVSHCHSMARMGTNITPLCKLSLLGQPDQLAC